jgi:hypothetical protein
LPRSSKMRPITASAVARFGPQAVARRRVFGARLCARPPFPPIRPDIGAEGPAFRAHHAPPERRRLYQMVEAVGCHREAKMVRQFDRNLTPTMPRFVSEGEMQAGDDSALGGRCSGPLTHGRNGGYREKATWTGGCRNHRGYIGSWAGLGSRVECARTDRCRHAKPATEGYRANQPTHRPRRGTVVAADAG